MLNELRKHGLLLKGVLLGLVSLMMVIVVIIPSLSRAQKAQSDLKAKKIKADELSAQVIFLTNIDEEVQKQRMTALDMTLPPRKDLLLYLSTIDGLSRDLGLVMRGVQLSPGELATNSATKANSNNVAGVQSLETQLTIAGNYESIMGFLRAVEQTAPLMRVKDVQVSRVGESGYTLNVVLEMLYSEVVSDTSIKGKMILFDDKEEKLISELMQLKSYSLPASLSATTNTGKADLFAPALQQEN